MYLNQSVPPYGVSLNSLAEQYSAFPLRKGLYFSDIIAPQFNQVVGLSLGLEKCKIKWK